MNYGNIFYVLGWIFSLEGILMIPSLICGLIYGESVARFLAYTIALCLVIGVPVTRMKPKSNVMYAKEGFVTVALSWIVLSLMGALPFYLSGEIPSYVDAVFETSSGFTTSGASILTDVEAMSKCMLFWRSFTHWIGGMGVLVFLLIVLPMAGGYYMNLMKAESPGPSVDKLVPKVRKTAGVLYIIYFAMTVIEILLLLVSGMPLFDSMTLSFGTAGTGGFGVLADSIGSYSALQQWIITIFMILFGVNFSIYWMILRKNWRDALRSEELHWYLGIILTAIVIIVISLGNTYGSFSTTLRHAAFQVGSIITTTGYATVDFDAWPEIARTVLVVLMFIGASAGSTGGGIKVSRILLFIRSSFRELFMYLHPNGVKKVTLDGKAVREHTLQMVSAYMGAYVILFALSVILISLEGHDGVTNFTAVAATFNNIGPGLNMVGPAQNFAFFNPFSKIILIFDMLAGRLELFPMLILLYPATWRKH